MAPRSAASHPDGAPPWASSGALTAKPTAPIPLNQAERAKSKPPGTAGGGGGIRIASTLISAPLVNVCPPTGAIIFDGERSGPYLKGRDQGAAFFDRLEGCWYGNDVVYFCDTAGGPAGTGVVWRYEPPRDELLGTGILTALFVSSGPLAGNQADNITVSPRGGLLFCEERGDATRLMGVTPDGCSYAFAANHVVIEEPLERLARGRVEVLRCLGAGGWCRLRFCCRRSQKHQQADRQ